MGYIWTVAELDRWASQQARWAMEWRQKAAQEDVQALEAEERGDDLRAAAHRAEAVAKRLYADVMERDANQYWQEADERRAAFHAKRGSSR